MPHSAAAPELGKLLLTAEETGKTLGIGRTAVYRLQRQGQLHGVLIGSSRRFPREDIEAYVQRLRELATDDAGGAGE